MKAIIEIVFPVTDHCLNGHPLFYFADEINIH